jgi:sec-independent protein translocase protein TatA
MRPPSRREAGKKERPTAWRWSASRRHSVLPSRPHWTGLKEGKPCRARILPRSEENGTNAGGVPFDVKKKGAQVIAFLQGIGAPELIIILVIVLLLFGAKKLPEMARSLGKSQREFKKGMREGAEEADQDEKDRELKEPEEKPVE